VECKAGVALVGVTIMLALAGCGATPGSGQTPAPKEAAASSSNASNGAAGWYAVTECNNRLKQTGYAVFTADPPHSYFGPDPNAPGRAIVQGPFPNKEEAESAVSTVLAAPVECTK
jgi:hypothetical protein